jgi:hypothetical protein
MTKSIAVDVKSQIMKRIEVKQHKRIPTKTKDK